ncbi:MAG: peptidoglycan editing factor PgeF [Chloroflexi bacterium]|nr:peptidoglycan editing factor PgeF [Chloroflexota bacterium]
MPFHQPDKLRYFTFDIFETNALTHAVFTRRGGVSPAPWAYLNVGATVGDEFSNVLENRQRSFKTVGREIETMFDSWLVHGAQVIIVDEPRSHTVKIPPKADILLTDKSNITLFMRFADCVPILLYDPIRHVVGLLHAGWKGTIKRAAQAGIQAMKTEYGTRPGDILAAIGPSIGAHHYEVGNEVIEAVQNTFGGDSAALLPSNNGSVKFDLWKANRLILEQAGVGQIEVAEICTACHMDDWFSHRGEQGYTGRFGALIGLNPF